jgi:hypothetical protein
MDVRYFGNGTTALVIGEGATRTVDDGRGNVSEVPTQRVIVLDDSQIEDVEADQLLSERPELHPDTGRPLSETEAVDSGAKIDPRGGPNAAQLEAEIARLRAENESYRSTQDRGGSTQPVADQQPATADQVVTGSEAAEGTQEAAATPPASA